MRVTVSHRADIECLPPRAEVDEGPLCFPKEMKAGVIRGQTLSSRGVTLFDVDDSKPRSSHHPGGAGAPRSVAVQPVAEGLNDRVVDYRFKWLRRDRDEPDDRRLAPRAFVWTDREVHHLTWSELKRLWKHTEPEACPACEGPLVRFAERIDRERRVTGVCVRCGLQSSWREDPARPHTRA